MQAGDERLRVDTAMRVAALRGHDGPLEPRQRLGEPAHVDKTIADAAEAPAHARRIHAAMDVALLLGCHRSM